MSSMSITTFLKVAPLLPVTDSVLLRGGHGIGKSKLIRQLTHMLEEQDGIKYEFIDRRLAQLSEGDVIGLPSTDGEVTRFNPPDWYRRACATPCVLFLDELNRASPEVMQASFQIVLDRELNGWKLHPKTRVYSAVNIASNYTVNDIDPALLDRFWAIDLEPTKADWVKWAKDDGAFGGNISSVMIDFISQNEKWLDPPKNPNPGDVATSRRSWEKLDGAHKAAGCVDQADNELFFPICLGFIGAEAALSYHEFVKTQDNQFTGEEIINAYSKVRKKVTNKSKQDNLNTAIEKVSDVVNKMKKLTEAQGKNLRAFMQDLPGELQILCWVKLTDHGVEKVDLIKSIHKHVVDLVVGVYGVKVGPEGVGMTPNIPDMTSLETANDKKKK